VLSRLVVERVSNRSLEVELRFPGWQCSLVLMQQGKHLLDAVQPSRV